MQDDYNGAFEAVEHLIERGYRKIAHIAGPEGLSFTQKRKKGYLDALEKHGLTVKIDGSFTPAFPGKTGRRMLKSSLAAKTGQMPFLP